MGADDDDDEREPLPDPTMRTWRHPSELAAVASMSARSGEPPRRRRLSTGSLALGVALGALAAVTVMASTSVLSTEPSGSRVQFRTPPSVTAPAVASPTTVPASTTTAAAPPATSTLDPSPSAPATEPTPPALDDELAATNLAAVPPEAVIGVAVGDGDAAPTCTAVVVDGLVVTSASAIGSASEVSVVIGGHRHVAEVVGRDRFTDVAVLAPPADVALTALVPADGVAEGDAVALVATDGRPEPIAVIGRVLAVGQTGSTSGGHPLLGLVATTARLPQPGAGALLLNPAGQLVGMVVDGPDHLAAAVPYATVRQVARSLADTGHPALVWVGISVLGHADGVRLNTVHPGGPADVAGLRPGDVVVALGGEPVGDLAGFIARLRAFQPGEAVRVAVERRGEPVEVELVLGSAQRGSATSSAPAEEQAAN